MLVIIGFDALSVNDDLRNALKKYGYGGDGLLYNVSVSRTSFVFIGQKGMPEGTAYYKMSKTEMVSLTASVSNGVLIGMGHKGDKGDKGVDGTQYRTVEKYAYGDSNTVAPTSGWSDSISGGTAGKYLWNQETAQHKAATDTVWVTDSVTTHCIGYIAKNGENGANFTGVLEHYKATNDGTNAPTVDGSWQSTPNAAGWSADKPYLWNYETVQRDKGGSITTNAHLDGVWGKQGIKGDSYSVTFLLNGARVDVLNFDDVRTLTDATFEADFYNQGAAVNIPKATLTCYDKDGNVLGSPIEIADTSNIVADGGNLYLSKDCKTITAVGKDGENVLFSSSVAVIRSTITYRLIPMSDCSATVKASGTSTSAVFKLSYNLHYKAAKLVGDRAEDATIATIVATIENKDVTTTVNNTEGTLSDTGAKSYTSDNRPADSIPVTVTLSNGTVLYDNVKVTMEAGVAIDINQKIGQLQTTVAGKADISTIKQTANEISMSIASQKKYRNLLKGTDFSYIPDNMSLLPNGEGNVVEITDSVLYDSDKTLHINTKNTGYYDGIYMRPITIQTKTAYVFSVWAKGSGKIALETIYQDDSGNRAGRPDFHGDNEAGLTPDWKLYKVWFTSDDTYTKLECNIWANYVAGEMWIAHPMLEESSQYSGWTLSPDDPTTEQLLAQTGIDIRKGVIDLRAGKVAYLGANGKPYITAELDDEGMPHLIFYNKAGTKMYDLGYTGMFDIIQDSQEQKWVEYSGVLGVGKTISCKDLVPGYAKYSETVKLSGGTWSQVLQGEITIYEYHSAYFMSSGNEKTYYHQEDNYLLYKSNSVNSSDNNAPTGDKVFTANGVPQGFLYEPYGTPSHTESTKNGTTIFNDTRTYYAHDIALDKFMNYSSGGIKVVVQRSTIFIGDSDPTYEYKWRVGSGDWQDGETITTMK